MLVCPTSDCGMSAESREQTAFGTHMSCNTNPVPFLATRSKQLIYVHVSGRRQFRRVMNTAIANESVDFAVVFCRIEDAQHVNTVLCGCLKSLKHSQATRTRGCC